MSEETGDRAAKPKQIILCANEAQRERAAQLFPALEARYLNGEGWDTLAGRRVVAFGQALADQAAEHAAEVKVLPEDMPSVENSTQALAWAKSSAIPYKRSRELSTVTDSPPPGMAQDSPPATSSPRPEGGEPDPQEPPQATESPTGDAAAPHEPIPLEAYETRPKPALARPERPERPKRRHLKSVFSGNNALALEDDPEPLPASLSEDHVASEFAAAQQNDLRYVAQRNQWYLWSDGIWKPDAKKAVDRRVVNFCREVLTWQDALSLSAEGRRKIGSKRFAGNVRDTTAHDERIATEVAQFDQNPWLLGVPGGVVDLREGKVIEAEREHWLTRQTAVAPAAGEPVAWLKFISHICRGDDSLVAYVQRWCGYLLTGDGSEECLLFCYGPAQRGKSKFVNALREMMGGYAATAGMETFTESRMERHSEELATLAGARMIVASETEAGRRWNEARIKALTGRDMIRARMLHENSFEFQLGKIVIAGNHAPALRTVDDTFRRRLHILEFSNPVPEDQIDRRLDDKLREEYPQILQWAIQGCLAWRDYGLGKPEEIAHAVENYMESEDTLAEWIEEKTLSVPAHRTLTGDLYASYRRWAEQSGEYVLSQKRFAQQLADRGFERIRSGGKRYVVGLRLPEFSGLPGDPGN